MKRISPSKPEREKTHPVVKAARRESRQHGYEVRPTVVKDTAEAERLSRGFRMLEGSGDDE